MKNLFYLTIMITVGGLFVSCNGNKSNEPQTLNAEKMLEMSLAYFPYNEKDSLEFVNDQTGRKWDIETYSINKSCRTGKEGSESQGISKSIVDVKFTVKDVAFIKQQNAKITFNIIADTFNIGKDTYIFMSQFVYIPLSDDEIYSGQTEINCNEVDFYSYFSDTIMIPLTEDLYNRSTPLPEGAYARLVKNKGLTDFSVDGTTIWKRVQ